MVTNAEGYITKILDDILDDVKKQNESDIEFGGESHVIELEEL